MKLENVIMKKKSLLANIFVVNVEVCCHQEVLTVYNVILIQRTRDETKPHDTCKRRKQTDIITSI